MTDPTDDLPPIVAIRGAAAPDWLAPYRDELAQAGAEMARARDRPGRPMFVNRHGLPPLPEPMVVPGGWSAPPGTTWPSWRHPWERPDLPWTDLVDVDRWLFPRLAAVAARVRDYQRRARTFRSLRRCSWRALRTPQPDYPDEDR